MYATKVSFLGARSWIEKKSPEGLRPADVALVIKPVHGHMGYPEGMDRIVQEFDVIA